MRNDVSKLCCFLDNLKALQKLKVNKLQDKVLKLFFSSVKDGRLSFRSFFCIRVLGCLSIWSLEHLTTCALIGWRWAGAGTTAWGLAAPPACSPPALAGGWCAAPAGWAGCWGSRMLRRPAAGSAPRAGCWPHASPFLQGGRGAGGGGGAWLGGVSWKRLQVFILIQKQELTSLTYLNFLFTTICKQMTTSCRHCEAGSLNTNSSSVFPQVSELDSVSWNFSCLQKSH